MCVELTGKSLYSITVQGCCQVSKEDDKFELQSGQVF